MKKGRPQNRVTEILVALEAYFPAAECALDFTSPIQLLVATILSAQCTDKQVNRVTPRLFECCKTVNDFVNIPREELEDIIHATGFYRAKARHIQEACAAIVTQYGGRVPETLAELVTLPGVGRKTANVVLGTAFGVAEGIVVDTHVARLSQRIGLSASHDPVRIERDLIAVIPHDSWIDFSHRLIQLGRTHCKANRTDCAACPLESLCKSAHRSR
ncbi:MAG: endonuclease III [Thermoguttaceae bacterium]